MRFSKETMLDEEFRSGSFIKEKRVKNTVDHLLCPRKALQILACLVTYWVYHPMGKRRVTSSFRSGLVAIP